MSRLPVKHLSKVQNFLWNYDTAKLAIFRDKQMLGALCFTNTGSSFNYSHAFFILILCQNQFVIICTKSWCNILLYTIKHGIMKTQISQPWRKWYLSFRWTAKSQTSLHIRPVSPELFAIHTINGTRGSFRTKSWRSCPIGWVSRCIVGSLNAQLKWRSSLDFS